MFEELKTHIRENAEREGKSILSMSDFAALNLSIIMLEFSDASEISLNN